VRLKRLDSKNMHIKNLYLIFIIIMAMSIKCWSQETFYEILKQLNIQEDVTIPYNFKNSVINQDSSFFIKKNARSRCDLKYILLSKNERFSVFGVFGADETNKTFDNMSIFYSHIVLFDKLKNRVFVIEYGFEGHVVFVNNKNKKLEAYGSSFQKNLSRITEMDYNFIPKWSLLLTYFKLEEDEHKIEYPICWIDKYIFIDNIWYKKNKLFENKIPFKTLLYQELLDFENENFDEFMLIKCGTDDNFLPMYRLGNN